MSTSRLTLFDDQSYAVAARQIVDNMIRERGDITGMKIGFFEDFPDPQNLTSEISSYLDHVGYELSWDGSHHVIRRKGAA